MLSLPADLADEERELLLDLTQLLLDVVGIFEPTPFADSTSALISLYRGQWLQAGISVVAAAVPYAGDAAKVLKIPGYERSFAAALNLALKNPRFAALLHPIIEQFLVALRRVPMDRIPSSMQSVLTRMQNRAIDFLHLSGKGYTRIDHLVDDVLIRVVGSSKNVGVLPRMNVRTIVEFFERHGVEGGNVEKWAGLIKGIDLHAVEAVKVTKFRPGELVTLYVEAARPANRQIGQWMVRAQGAVSEANLGLSAAGRVPKTFRVTKPVEVLQSKAAPAADHWTMAGTKTHQAVVVQNGKHVRLPAEQVAGGGDQYFLPRAWEALEAVN